MGDIFNDPRYVKTQIVRAKRDAPILARSLDSLLGTGLNGRALAELGAGMGHLAYEMYRRCYSVLVEEPSRQSLDMLRDREQEFYAHLQASGLLFNIPLWEFVRHIVDNRMNGVFDAVYSNEGPLLVMHKKDGTYVVESHEAVQEGEKIVREPSVDRVLECFRGLRAGIRSGGMLVLSVSAVPDETFYYEYQGIPVDYAISSDYDSNPSVVVRTRFITGGGMDDISHVQEKVVLSDQEFLRLAMNAGFSSHNFSKDGKWFWVK